MKSSMRERLKYRFENFMAKGGIAIFLSLFILFLVAFGITIGLRWLLLLFVPGFDGFDTFLEHIWNIFLQITDAGNMGTDTDSSILMKITAIITGLTGVIIFSMLIAFITTQLEDLIYQFRKGRSKVIEKNHTLIIGWNEKVFDIIRELVIANESEKYASVVILADVDKEQMDETLAKYIPDPKTTRIITRSGDPLSLTDLKRINASRAKSAIILANCSDNAALDERIDSDTRTLKIIMALLTCKDAKGTIPIIAEIFTEEKRNIIKYFNSDTIISLDSMDILGKLLVQTSLSSGLEMVYNEILSFDGSEIYFYKAEWNGILFSELPYHFEDGIPLGVHTAEGQLLLNPTNDRVMHDDDEIVILANDDSTIKFKKNKLVTPAEVPFADKKLDRFKKEILILGWHNIGKVLVREYADYLQDGSKIDIMISKPSDSIKTKLGELKKKFQELQITLYNGNPLTYKNLAKINPLTYDNIIILSQDEQEVSSERIDSDTLIILLLLKRIAEEHPDQKSHIITQVLNSENQELIMQSDVDDFIISNKLVTMVLAQLSEQPAMKKFYDDIFSEAGSEIYVKDASLYFKQLPATVNFADIIALADKRKEICLGIRYGALSKAPDKNFGVVLNIPKNKQVEITRDDFLIVLAEDEV